MKKIEKRKSSKLTVRTHSKGKMQPLKNINKLAGGSAAYWATSTPSSSS